MVGGNYVHVKKKKLRVHLNHPLDLEWIIQVEKHKKTKL